MGSPVLELQQLAIDSKSPVIDVLRKAYLVATKLKLQDASVWIQHEMQGYPVDVDVPAYRKGTGRLHWMNPVTKNLCPIIVNGHRGLEEIETWHNRESVTVIQSLADAKEKFIRRLLPQKVCQYIRDNLEGGRADFVEPFVLIASNAFCSPLEQARNKVLTWALELENRGVLGEGMTFSPDEKQKSMSASQIIHNYGTMNNAAALGDGSTASVSVNDPAALAKLIEGTALNAAQRAEILGLIKAFHDAKEAEKPDLRARVLAFVGKYAKELAGAGVTIASALLAG